MKVLNRVCQILAIILALGALALFFTHFATITSSAGEASFVGAELAFGVKKDVGGTTYEIARSTKILFCFILTALGLGFSAASFKFKGLRYAAPVTGLVSGIFMLVVTLGKPNLFIDTRSLPDVPGDGISYGAGLDRGTLWCAIAILAFAVVAAAYLFIDDYLEVLASKGNKRTIWQHVVAFFKDYKSEIKKIVWPGFKDVLKNTLIVLIMCLVVGAFIWLLDFGLGNLLKLILRT